MSVPATPQSFAMLASVVLF